MPQPQPRQKSRFDEIQMLQRQIMFKQLQELQRQQQLQDFGDARQHNFVNQQSLVNKHTSGAQVSPLINGTPIRDASQMFMLGGINLVQHGTSSVGQGFPNGLDFSQTQSQALRSMGLVSQQPQVSSYGTTLATAGNNLNQYSHLQGASHDAASLLVKDNNNQPEKNLFGQVPTQGLNSGVQPCSIQQVNSLQRNSSLQKFGGKLEQGGWPGLFSGKTTNVDPSQGVSSLDPLEQKILFNMDDNSWEASFGKPGGTGTGGFDNLYESTDHMGAFPSVQSGSWSALMQSAVGEASSSDTGLQEEWSGLSFQNPELSTDNQHSNFVESGKQPANWIDNNFQSASSLSSKPGHLINNPNASSNFPGFQHFSGAQFHFQQKEDMRSDSSHESIQQSPKKATEWSGYYTQQKQFADGNESGQRFSPLQNAWPDQSIDCLESDTHQKSMLVYHNNSTTQVEPGNNRHIPESRKLDCMNQADTSVKDGRSKSMTDDHPQLCNSPRGLKGRVGEFKFSDNASTSAVNFEKGGMPDSHRNFSASDEAPPISDVGSGVSAFYDRSSGFHAPNVTAQTSENMLELLHKVDKSKEYRAETYIGSIDSTPISEVPQAQSSDASVAQSHNQSSASQYFGLRLAPPTQRLGNSNYVDSSRIPMHSENSPTAFRGPQYERIQLHNQFSVTHQSLQATPSGMGSRFPAFSPANSQETSHLISTSSYNQQLPNFGPKQVIQPPTASGMSQQVAFSTRPPNVWIDVPNQENPSAVEPRKFPFGLHTLSDATKGRLETASGASLEMDKDYFKGGNNSQEIGACLMNSQGFVTVGEQPAKERSGKQMSAEIFDTGSHGQKSFSGYPSEANAVASGSVVTGAHQEGSDRARHSGNQAPAISVKDLEAFGRSLKQSHVPPQKYIPLNQLHSVKNEESNVPLVTAKSQINSSVNVFSQSLLEDTCQDTFTSNRDDSQSHFVSNHLASNETQRSQISFPMSSSFIKNYGTLKNGQMLPMYEARVANDAVQQFSVRKPFEGFQVNSSLVQMNFAGASQASNVLSATATNSVAGKHLSSPYLLNTDVTDQNTIVLRPKKRKFSTFELLPWHKEVTKGSLRLQDISVADLEWAQAVNRLPEKLNDEGGAIEGLLPLARPKKRLIMTTQLMQQLFRPAPAVIFSEDATSHCDTVTFFAARLALGDACSLTSHSHMPHEGSDLLSGKRIISERIGDHEFSKIVEDFMNRSKRLEGELFRLEKGGSIVDMRVEFQELEKFSVINRFAKFHSRGQMGTVETMPSATTSNVLKLSPQRYVIAIPMPKTVPEGAQCLSL